MQTKVRCRGTLGVRVLRVAPPRGERERAGLLGGEPEVGVEGGEVGGKKLVTHAQKRIKMRMYRGITPERINFATPCKFLRITVTIMDA
jgi:hypothetical protein